MDKEIALARELVFCNEEEAREKLKTLIPGATLTMSGPNATVTLADGRQIEIRAE